MRRDISVKGVARKFAGMTEGFSVRDAFFDRKITGTRSLHAALSSMATRELFFDRSECDGMFKWTAGFTQTWTHIHVDICIFTEKQVQGLPDEGVSQGELDQLVSVWQPAIEGIWSNRWACGRPGELPCRLTVSVAFSLPATIGTRGFVTFPVCIGGHHEVVVLNEVGRSNMTTWYLGDPRIGIDGDGVGVAHEFGHMLGLDDEYPHRDCPDRNISGTIMGWVVLGDPGSVPARLMTRFANNIGSEVVPI